MVKLMKRFIATLSIVLLLSLNMNTINAFAQPKTFSQGFYTMRDLGLSENIPSSVQNLSPYTNAFIIVLDENQIIQQLLRLSPSSPKYNLTPLKNSFCFIIYGDNINIVFS